MVTPRGAYNGAFSLSRCLRGGRVWVELCNPTYVGGITVQQMVERRVCRCMVTPRGAYNGVFSLSRCLLGGRVSVELGNPTYVGGTTVQRMVKGVRDVVWSPRMVHITVLSFSRPLFAGRTCVV